MPNIVKTHFDHIAHKYDAYKIKNKYYYTFLKSFLCSIIPADKKVLEIGCGTGDLLVHLKPKYGVGIDISSEMIKIAKVKHPLKKLHFQATPIENFKTREKFDYIYMSDVIEHLTDTKSSFKSIGKLVNKDTIFINTMVNPIWEAILMHAEKLGLKMPEGPHNRITYPEIMKLYEDNSMKVVKHSFNLLMPIYIPFVSNLINTYFEPHLKKLCFMEYFIAKKV